jgi:hypothetical protein
MEDKIIFGYDVLTYNGPIPNCLNPKFLNTIYTASDFYYQNSGEFFSKRWNCDWVIYNSDFHDKITKTVSLHNIKKDKEDGNFYKWFYPIEPFGNLDHFFGNHHIHNSCVLSFMSKNAIDLIKNSNGNILFNYIVDGGLGVNLENFQKIIDFTRGNDIPDEKVYFIFADFKLAENFKKLGVKYKVLDFSYSLIAKSQEFNNTLEDPNWSYWGNDNHEPQVGKIENPKSSIASYDDFEASIGSDKKDFLILTRHWKLHRLLLLSQIHKLGLDKSLVSWDNKFYHIDSINELLRHDDNLEFSKLISETSSLLDVQDLTKIAGYGFENKDIYLNTYISIVTESIFFQSKGPEDIHAEFPSGYLSEKVWKPIGHSQPFILAGPAKSLKYIRNRFGFKTFHPYIDESYDLEPDDFARLRMIQAEIEKFANKTKEEKDQFLNDVKHIVKHNRNLFVKYGKNSYEEIKDNREMQLIINFLLDLHKSII